MTTELTTIVCAFNDQKIAGRAIDALRKEGFRDGDIKILKGDAKKLISQLAEHGFGKEDARRLADAAAEGKTLVAASVSEEEADDAAAILDRYEASQDEDQGSGRDKGRGETVEIVEEELNVGKSKVANGGVRVTSSVSERPVEETVTLREERVGAKRRSADRELDADEAEAAFQEKTVEMMGIQEEAEVVKEARVVGEVELTKETEEREETVRDTVRKTDVKVDNVKASSAKRK